MDVNNLIACFNAGNYLYSEKLALCIIQEDPKHELAWKILAAILNSTGRFNELLKVAQHIVTLVPNEPEPHYILGNALLQLGVFQEAEISFRKSIYHKPLFAEAHYRLANTLKLLSRLQEAEIHYRKAILINNNYVEAIVDWGHLLNLLLRFEDAEIILKKAIEINPKLPEAYINLGITLDQLGKYHEAEIVLKKAILLKPDYAEIYGNLGVTLNQLGKFVEAENVLKFAISLRQDYSEAYSNLGITLKELHKINEAKESYKKAISINPKNAQAYNNLGVILQESGNLDHALQFFYKAIESNVNYSNAKLNLSILFIRNNNIEDSLKILLQLVNEESGHVRLIASIKLAVLSFIAFDIKLSEKLIHKSKEILFINNKFLKNDVAYFILINNLISWWVNNKYNLYIEAKKLLYVIGESHAMPSNGLYVDNVYGGFLCKVNWIPGCKQWHLGNANRNQYKEQFEKVFLSIPYESTILLSIGEIDCRIDDGLLKHIKKYPSTNLSALIESTIENYLTYVYKLTIINSNNVVIQGVPCPNIDPLSVGSYDLSTLINLINQFNYELRVKSKKFGFEFLDLHTLTDRGDGYSNGIWHIDEYHLSPAGMIEAWKRHLA